MYCVKSKFTIEDSIKKSRFIGVIMPCANENDVLINLKQLHQEYPDASHIAYAYRIKTDTGLSYRFHDAGEPAGTAGKPIFLHLGGNDLVNSFIAVIRYFGGVKLGPGGLIRAYGNTARQVIEAAEVSAFIEWVKIPLTLAYNRMQALEHLLKNLNGRILHKDFSEQIHLLIELPANQLTTLSESFPGDRSSFDF